MVGLPEDREARGVILCPFTGMERYEWIEAWRRFIVCVDASRAFPAVIADLENKQAHGRRTIVMLEEYVDPARCPYPPGGSQTAATRLTHWQKEIAPIDAALENAPKRKKALKGDARQALTTLMRVHARLWRSRRRTARWVRWAYVNRPLPPYLWFYKRGHLWWMT